VGVRRREGAARRFFDRPFKLRLESDNFRWQIVEFT